MSYSTTNATVSFEAWQHLCFTIDTISKLWGFYKDGLLTDIATLDLPKVSTGLLDVEDNKVFLARKPGEVTNFLKRTDFDPLRRTFSFLYED